jgi:hypothetical protein
MQESNYHRFPWRIFALAGLLSLAWLALSVWGGWRADLAESNLQANLIRITRYLQADSPDIVLLGSSISGRLLPEYFNFEGREVLNLGLDGSGPLFAFEILSQQARRPNLVLLEADSLFRPLSGNDSILREAMGSTTAKLSEHLALFRPEVRPFTVAYARLKSWRDGLAQGRQRPPHHAAGPVEGLPSNYDSVKNKVAALKAQGSRIFLVNMPAGEGWAMPLAGPAKLLAEELQLEVLEPGVEIHQMEGDVLRFTDGLHLDGPSAAKVSRILASRLDAPRELPKEPDWQ